MKKSTLLIASAAAIVALSACSDDINFSQEGEGKLILSAKINTEIRTSRAATEDELRSSCKIWISKADKGVMYKYNGIEEFPAAGLWMTAGNYVAEVWAGDSVSASFESRYFKGSQAFTITAGGAMSVEVNCKVANVVAAPSYAPEIDERFTDYHMVVGHSRGSLDFTGENATSRGYFMMPSTDTDLTYTFEGTLTTGEKFTRTGTVANVQPATLYTLKVVLNSDNSDLGGGYLDITVDDTPVADETDEILISVAPTIAGYRFDMNQSVFMTPGNYEQKSVFIKATSAMKSVILTSESFRSALNLDGNDFDIMEAQPSVVSQINANGLVWTYNYDAATDMSDMKITFKEDFFENITEGNYTVDFYVKDANDKVSTAQMSFSVTMAKVEAADVEPTEVTRSEVVLRGNLMKADATNYGFEYREAASSRADEGWTFVAAEKLEGTVYTVRLTGLKAGVTYEYRAVCDDYVGQIIKTVTTAPRGQLPNAGMEEWQTSSTPYLPWKAGDQSFWDTGNHGSATLKKNISSPASDYSHSGVSAKLESQFCGVGALGKFAAGNIFVGSYLGTDGTDGIVGFGRPFDDTPTALKVWVRYEPGTIQWDNSDTSDFTELKGKNDTGIIFVALMDDSNNDKTYGDFPFVVRTKKSQKHLFSKDEPNVIAYGAWETDQQFGGTGMAEVTIPLNYNRTGVVPSYVVLTVSASKLGDYFVGGKSTMWVDDFEFVYE